VQGLDNSSAAEQWGPPGAECSGAAQQQVQGKVMVC
jgi:hypothetical protein